MMENQVTQDEKLWAALAYVFSPISPVIIFLMEDKKSKPFIKLHAVQALVLGLLIYVLSAVLSMVFIGCLIAPLGILAELYLAYQAYQGKTITIPYLTDFIKQQGWA